VFPPDFKLNYRPKQYAIYSSEWLEEIKINEFETADYLYVLKQDLENINYTKKDIIMEHKNSNSVLLINPHKSTE